MKKRCWSLFGHYITEQGLENLRVWRYKSGGATQLDRLMNPWWEFVASLIPSKIVPNSLTLVGFVSTIVALCLVLFYMPTLEEEAPRWCYFVVAILLFIHQTADAVDGKHARNTGTSSPLGQIFDHGCDAFSTVFAVFVTAATTRLGLSWATFMLLGLLQMQMFIYTWWELHFHVYRCSTGATGVTEGQLIMIVCNLAAGILGPSVYLMTIDDIFPQHHGMLAALGINGVRIQAFVATPFYLLLMYMVLVDIIRGCRTAPEKAYIQLLGCMGHIIVQYFFYASGLTLQYPALCCLIIIANSSVVALRMNISAACRLPIAAFHWPATPFYLVGVALYITGHTAPPGTVGGRWTSVHGLSMLDGYDSRAIIGLLCCMLLWPIVYLCDFVLSSVDDMCEFLGIYCFSLEYRPGKHWGTATAAGGHKEWAENGEESPARAGDQQAKELDEERGRRRRNKL